MRIAGRNGDVGSADEGVAVAEITVFAIVERCDLFQCAARRSEAQGASVS